MDNNSNGDDAGSRQKEMPFRKNAEKPISRGKGIVSAFSLAASALAVVCFVTGRTTLSSFLSPSSVSSIPAAAPAGTQTEQLFSQAAFFVHYGHLPGRGTDDYDADDTEEDRQKLIAGLESYIASVPIGPSGKAGAAAQKSLARAQGLRDALARMKSGSLFNLPALPNRT